MMMMGWKKKKKEKKKYYHVVVALNIKEAANYDFWVTGVLPLHTPGLL